MVTTKNWGALWLSLLAPVLLVLSGGCTPPGARALLEGDRLARAGKYAQAVEKLKVATQLLPVESQARAWNHLGLTYHWANQPNEAVAAYRQAIQRNPNLAAARYNLGCLFLEQNKLPEAISEFTTCTVLDRNAFSGWVKLGTAQLRSRLWDAAELTLHRALQLNANSAEALNGLALIQVQKKRLREAAHYLNLAVQREPDYAPALLNQGILQQFHLHDRAAALQKYRAYLNLKPTPVYASSVQGLVRQLELELNPPPRVLTTNPPAPARPAAPVLVSATNPPPVPARTSAPPILNPVASQTPAPTKTSTPPAVAHAPPKQTPPASQVKPSPAVSQPRTQAPPVLVKTEPPPPPKIEAAPPPKVEPAPPPSQATNPPPLVQKPTPKVEVIELTNEPPPKLAQDVAPPPPPPEPKPASATPPPAVVLTSAPPSGPITGPIMRSAAQEPKRGLVRRLNPLNWFRGKSKPQPEEPADETDAAGQPPPESPVASTPQPSEPAPPSAPEPKRIQVPRYGYRAPPKPAAGDRVKAERLFAEGFKAHQERRLAAAMERYREALRLDPAFYEASFNLGLAAFELKDSPTSLAAYETALAIDPRSVDARYNFALALQRGNYLIDAADELEKILARHPDESRAHFSLGKLYAERLSRFDLARLHYRRLLELQPHHPQATAIRYWLAAHP